MIKKEQGFSDKQIDQLTGLFDHQRKSIVGELREYVDQRFIEERSVTRQIIQLELQDIRSLLDKIELKIENDTKAALDEIENLKKRVAALEKKFV